MVHSVHPLPHMPTLFVAHYGHPQLKGAKHWALLLPKGDGVNIATAYQVTGSTTTYEVKAPEDVRADNRNCMGTVEVGRIEESRRKEFERVVLSVPVTRGIITWNCQNWVIDTLAALKTNGFAVKTYTLLELQEFLGKTSR